MKSTSVGSVATWYYNRIWWCTDPRWPDIWICSPLLSLHGL